jgi:hypothetical protein
LAARCDALRHRGECLKTEQTGWHPPCHFRRRTRPD